MMPYPTDIFEIAGLITSVILIWGIYSFPLYKENPYFKLTVHTFVGAAMAMLLITVIKIIISGVALPLVQGNLSVVPIIFFAALLYTRFSKKYVWISRWPVAIVTGIGLGVSLRAHAHTDVVSQTIALIKPLWTPTNWITGFNTIVILIGSIATIAYFTFTIKSMQKGSLSRLSQVGRLFIMFTLGAYFGNTTLARFSLLLERIEFTLRVLKILPY